ncbi:hypothetical protein D9M72_92420 [compost metagenome]
MKVSTDTLTEGQLNWLIARTRGGDLRTPHLNRAASDWCQGGQIIDEEKLMIQPKLVNGDWYGEWRSVCLSWEGRTHSDKTGETALIAAMRAHVHSMLADDHDGTVDIPGVLQ